MSERLDKFTTTRDATIRQVMECIDRNAKGIALVVDAQQRLVGTVTDGDLRRALLRGATLESPVEPCIGRGCVTVGVDADRSEVLDLMRARSLAQIPIINAEGKLVGLHVLREVLGGVVRANCALIMAGGRGERLKPLTNSVPKPMLRVAGKPILERLILHLVGYGIRKIYVAVHYLGELIEKHFADGSAFGCNIEYLHEARPLGTGGALSLLPEIPAEPLLVINGDLVTQANVGAMLELHSRADHMITLGIHAYSHTVPYGCVEVDSGRVVRFEEKPMVYRWVNAGIYVLSPAVVRRIQPECECSMPSLLNASVAAGERVGVFLIQDDWIDVGQLQQLGVAQRGF